MKLETFLGEVPGRCRCGRFLQKRRGCYQKPRRRTLQKIQVFIRFYTAPATPQYDGLLIYTDSSLHQDEEPIQLLNGNNYLRKV